MCNIENKKLDNKDVKLLISDEEIRRIFNMTNYMVCIASMDGYFLKVNSSFEQILGYSSEELLSRPFFDFIHPDDVKKTKDIVKDELSKGISIVKFENRYICKNGSIRWLSWSSQPGAEEGIMYSMAYDITDQKKAEEENIMIAEKLKKSNYELEQFAYIASHDLQEPSRVISSYCQLLRDKLYRDIDMEGEKYLDYIIDSSARMKTLIKELLDYSRVGKEKEPFEEINLNELLKEVLKDFEMSIRETKAKIIIKNDMPIIFGVRFRIKQLAQNLINNSLKFRSIKPPVIRIGCCEESTEKSWLFYIKDNGIGIKVEYYNRVFGIFKRLYSREEYPGTGIGLALCKRIVETHRGNIWIDSGSKGGTWIYFTIAKNILEKNNSCNLL